MVIMMMVTVMVMVSNFAQPKIMRRGRGTRRGWSTGQNLPPSLFFGSASSCLHVAGMIRLYPRIK
eukprot:6668568-Karenia_brevis.AAC.1